MTDNNKKITLIVSIVLIVIFIVIIIWQIFFNDTTEPEIIINTNTTESVNVNVEIVEVPNTNKDEVIIIDSENLSMERLASIFAERYGSYTSESEFKNTLELKVYMTDILVKSVDSYLASQSDQLTDGSYYSIVTKVISSKIISSDDSSGEIELITQRTENIGNTENIFYQNINLKLVYDNELWLVDKVAWGDKQ